MMEMWISGVAFILIFIGGMARVGQGILERPKEEPFLPRKFWSTTITTFFESLIAFVGTTFAGGMDGSALILFFAGCLILGYLGAKEVNKLGERALKKMSIGGKT